MRAMHNSANDCFDKVQNKDMKRTISISMLYGLIDKILNHSH